MIRFASGDDGDQEVEARTFTTNQGPGDGGRGRSWDC